MELKFNPRPGRPWIIWKRDFDKLSTVLGRASDSVFDLDPGTGARRTAYRVDSRTLGVFAVIGGCDAEAVCTSNLRDEIDRMTGAHWRRVLHQFGIVDPQAKPEGRIQFGCRWLRR